MHYRYRRSPASRRRWLHMMPYMIAGWLGLVIWYICQVNQMTEAVTDIRDAIRLRRR
ncbi:hypothetical protein GTO89_14120 [Heliobacterium gestii]|uniref:Uncharacterized protein n=1 Tax=Heliomicrobium gestii TaxID=2699 RepID=A0A845LGQ6_HELGE|nr:hypothetical protein [Heliomicrobium gestii]MBM7867777.1 hypothetical protein [Heliomicrobium gestii]MZP44170.1 hypothetical protein [Heliomicrobium gestii]